MKILIVEDDKSTASFIVKGFKENGFNARAAFNGTEGLDIMRGEDFDCIILDIMLPGIDGLTLLGHYRELNQDTPVIMLTAKDSVSDRVKGLSLGADDYLIKPFAFSELLARVKAILRRGGKASAMPQQSIMVIEDMTIDSIKHQVTRGGRKIDLTPKEFNLLWLLATRRDEVLSRTYISEQIWDMNFDTDTNVVDVALRRLRAKIDDDYTVKLIHTVRGVGYVLRTH